MQGRAAVATTKTVVHITRSSSNAVLSVTGDTYSLQVPPGAYSVRFVATSLGKPSPLTLGPVDVNAADTVRVDWNGCD